MPCGLSQPAYFRKNTGSDQEPTIHVFTSVGLWFKTSVTSKPNHNQALNQDDAIKSIFRLKKNFVCQPHHDLMRMPHHEYKPFGKANLMAVRSKAR